MLAAIRPRLADYSVDGRRLGLMIAFAAGIGVLASLVAKALLFLIGAITNLAYRGEWNPVLTPPDPRHFGLISIAIPVVGGLIVGCIARYGTDKIRGHGIPEAIQSILERDYVVQGRVAFWKPVASAITIGTGSPFGAEGPIIMTGGASDRSSRNSFTCRRSNGVRYLFPALRRVWRRRSVRRSRRC